MADFEKIFRRREELFKMMLQEQENLFAELLVKFDKRLDEQIEARKNISWQLKHELNDLILVTPF